MSLLSSSPSLGSFLIIIIRALNARAYLMYAHNIIIGAKRTQDSPFPAVFNL